MNKTIFLIGFPGCGKSTLGEVAARMLGRVFIDLDDFIEHQCGMTVKDIFTTLGEAWFREMEHEALQAVASSGAIVACGGGTPCHSRNMELMNAAGVTVWLTTSPQRLTARLCLPEHRAKRPQIAHASDKQIASYVKTTLKDREKYYRQAHIRFDSTQIETAEETEITAAQLIGELKLLRLEMTHTQLENDKT